MWSSYPQHSLVPSGCLTVAPVSSQSETSSTMTALWCYAYLSGGCTKSLPSAYMSINPMPQAHTAHSRPQSSPAAKAEVRGGQKLCVKQLPPVELEGEDQGPSWSTCMWLPRSPRPRATALGTGTQEQVCLLSHSWWGGSKRLLPFSSLEDARRSALTTPRVLSALPEPERRGFHIQTCAPAPKGSLVNFPAAHN